MEHARAAVDCLVVARGGSSSFSSGLRGESRINAIVGTALMSAGFGRSTGIVEKERFSVIQGLENSWRPMHF